ncbi:MAG: bifunctional biotin--[acetyl-CoA-carboxylase] ligase/biotin operon repressor BirA [Methylomicrobium sp.]
MSLTEQQRRILALLADGSFHSGSALAEALGVSRTSVWKQLSVLSDLGLEYAAISGKGYRLARPIEFLDRTRILSALDPDLETLVPRLEIYDCLDSTNTRLVELAKEQLPSGIVCLAEFQSAGRGRRGRHWVSPFGCNIYLSLLWRFTSGPAVISGLSLAIGVAVVRALSRLGFSDVGLKWPNDIYCQARKLGGILVEVVGETHGPCTTVIGLGLNVYLPEQNAKTIDKPWTDLTRIANGEPVSRNRLVGELLNELLPVVCAYENEGLARYLDEWRRYDCLYGQPVSLFQADAVISGNALGIDDNGLFLIEVEDGNVRRFASGDVSFSSH